MDNRISKKFTYIGLNTKSLDDPHVKEGVIEVLNIPRRISDAREWNIEAKDVAPLNGHPVVEITASCEANAQYCSDCRGYGCPGGC